METIFYIFTACGVGLVAFMIYGFFDLLLCNGSSSSSTSRVSYGSNNSDEAATVACMVAATCAVVT